MKEINIGAIITKKRREKGITQDELADYIGVSKPSVSKWETGQSYPDITFLPQLAAYFNITLDELMGYVPRMNDKDIKKLYHKLSEKFTNGDFQETLEECRSIIKKYYSCFPLISRMTVLLFNYHMKLDGEDKNALLREIADLCARVRIESKDIKLAQGAIAIEAYCSLILGEPQIVLELLGESVEPHNSYESTIAQAYAVMGKIDKAKTVTELNSYQYLLSFMESATTYFALSADNPEKALKFFDATLQIASIAELEKLNPQTAALLYTHGAVLYCSHGNQEKTIELLWKLTDFCTKRFFQVEICYNSFFDRETLKEWLTEIEAGLELPRSTKAIKESMYNDCILHPSFASLKENPEYKKIIKVFEKFIKEDN